MEAFSEQATGQLLLSWQGREWLVAAEEPLQVGRGDQAELRLRPGCVSRLHAEVQLNARNGRFELIDRSTNGTFVQTEDGVVTHVHRASLPLWGEGFLSFGEPMSEDRVVRFAHV